MPVSQNRALTERVDAIERNVATLKAHQVTQAEVLGTVCDALRDLIGPQDLKNEYRPVLTVIQGGAR